MNLTDSTTSDTVVINPEKAALENRIKELEGRLSLAIGFRDQLAFQHYIDNPPVRSPQELYQRACSSDGVTIETWLPTWLKHIKENSEIYDFRANSVMAEHGKSAYKPTIIIGSGPSLKYNVDVLAQNSKDYTIVACSHSFAFLEDNGVKVDYYVNLDSGTITIDELAQGGKKTPEYYWNLTKDRVLVTAITGHPDFHKKWQGEKRFYSVMASHPDFVKAHEEITKQFRPTFSVGGNCLGACLYFAKAILGACPIVFLGADFSFGYDKKFHSWDSPYDQQYSGLMYAFDIYGQKVGTWPSYYNFKNWFEFVACGGQGNQPGLYINCTEGGILGAYPEGNIRQIQQMRLKDFFWAYNLHKRMPEMLDPNAQAQLLF